MPPDLPPLRVALTGGIASGKTTVTDEFAALGVPIIDADVVARAVVAPESPALAALVRAFGLDILNHDGELDRPRMRARVFANPDDRRRLEAITHPAIREEIARLSSTATFPYQIHAIPLLVEGGRAGDYDRVVVVDVPEEVQIARVMSRDGIDRVQAKQILAAQARRTDRLALADDIIENSGDLSALRTQVHRLHGEYLTMAQSR